MIRAKGGGGAAPHPIGGTARVNLTFRHIKPEWQARVPQCRCGRPAVMKTNPQSKKAKAEKAEKANGPKKGGRGGTSGTEQYVYYYMCDIANGKPCGYYKRVDVNAAGTAAP